MYVVTVRFDVKPEHVDEFYQAMQAQARNSLEREPGCTHFDICYDPEDQTRIFLYEIYTDRSAFQTHMVSEHFLAFDAQVRDWVDGKEVETWSLRPAG